MIRLENNVLVIPPPRGSRTWEAAIVAMGDLHFLDVPIYRISYDAYNALMQESAAAQLANITHYGPVDPEVLKNSKFRIDQHQYDKFGPWRFNEILGYVRLHFLGSQIRGEHFSAEKKRNPISRNRVFTYRTHKLAPEINIPHQATNADIFALICEYVDDCRRELHKGRVIDDSTLMALGPHVDWRGLLGWPA